MGNIVTKWVRYKYWYREMECFIDFRSLYENRLISKVQNQSELQQTAGILLIKKIPKTDTHCHQLYTDFRNCQQVWKLLFTPLIRNTLERYCNS